MKLAMSRSATAISTAEAIRMPASMRQRASTACVVRLMLITTGWVCSRVAAPMRCRPSIRPDSSITRRSPGCMLIISSELRMPAGSGG